jgi:hypothetical protein
MRPAAGRLLLRAATPTGAGPASILMPTRTCRTMPAALLSPTPADATPALEAYLRHRTVQRMLPCTEPVPNRFKDFPARLNIRGKYDGTGALLQKGWIHEG